MDTKHPHSDIIDLWPTAGEFAKFVNREGKHGIQTTNARRMRTQGIPIRYWESVVKAAKTCGFPDITYAYIAELAKGAP